MGNRISLVSHKIIESVGGISVNETITYPFSGPDPTKSVQAACLSRETYVSLMSVITSNAASTPSSSTVQS
jgi:hypothetical protein